MRYRNPALQSKLCTNCNKFGLRLYISYHFVEYYGYIAQSAGIKPNHPQAFEMDVKNGLSV